MKRQTPLRTDSAARESMSSSDWRTTLRTAAVVQVKPKRAKRATPVGPTSDEAAVPKARKSKRRYSGGLLHALGVGERRVLGGLAAAAGDYLARSKKSAAKRRDGAVRDLARNLAKAQERAVAHLAKIPRDLTKAADVKRATTQVRKAVSRLGG